jgi:WD40 repeat protein
VKDAGVCEGHTGSVDTVTFSPEGSEKLMFASGSWDHNVCLWDATVVASGAPSSEAVDEDEEAAAGKSRKGKAAPSAFEPARILAAHTQAITGLCWPRPSTLY